MAYVIGSHCIDELEGSCVEVCPVDCIYEGARKRYINPTECIDCGACLPECPVDAIFTSRDEDPDGWGQTEAAFFEQPLPGHSEPLADPGGASGLGPVGVDATRVADWPKDV